MVLADSKMSARHVAMSMVLAEHQRGEAYSE